MIKSFSAAQLAQFRRNAKRLSRELSISHNEALDRIAITQGFKNWSLLSKHRGGLLSSSHSVLQPVAQPVDPRRRYYLHGDQMEDDHDRYYCVECDVFFDAAHFASHGPHTGERYLKSLERMKKRDWRFDSSYRRPDDAVNLLEGPALAARERYQALRPAFNDWLMVQRKQKRRDAIGLWAAWLSPRRGIPKTPKSLFFLQEHYRRRGVHAYEIEALEKAWDEFVAQTRSMP